MRFNSLTKKLITNDFPGKSFEVSLLWMHWSTADVKNIYYLYSPLWLAAPEHFRLVSQNLLCALKITNQDTNVCACRCEFYILTFKKSFNENQSEMLDSPVVNARTTIEICFIFQGLQRLFIQKSHSFFYSKERWKHSGSLLAVSFRTFVSLTFVSESSLIEGGFHASWITFALRECLM